MRKIILEVENINVFYEDVQVLWDLSFSVGEGEIVALVGSNGAGKTTTLKTISGIIHPKKGKIKFNGEEIQDLPPHLIARRGLSLVPEGRELFSEMTVLDNLLLGSMYIPEASKKTNDLLKKVFSLFPILEERKNQIAGNLSGGEQQMLAIARGLMSAPRLLMLDEPSLGLAPKLVSELFKTIIDIRDSGVTILLVEQNAYKSLEIADRAYVIETGKITLTGVGKELLKDDYVRKAYLGL
ncbi:MAG: ABC transporter ATP-binding protein [Candidatus Marinimicrobia bacterium]|nr:ABC transporter ATP-binding protein [Candidatus Neomarinimicrobiota bacterium]